VTSTADRLGTLRRTYRGRGDRRSRSDTAFVVYVGVLAAFTVGVPVLRAVVIALAQPAVVSARAPA